MQQCGRGHIYKLCQVIVFSFLQIICTYSTSYQLNVCSSPAHLHGVAEVLRVHGLFALLEVADVEVGQRVVDEAVHGAVRAVHVLVHHPGDEVRGEGDDKRLVGGGEVVGGWGVEIRGGNGS